MKGETQRAEHEWRNGVMMRVGYVEREARGVEGVKSFSDSIINHKEG